MKIEKERWYEGSIGKNKVHRLVEEVEVSMPLGSIPGQVVIRYKNEKSGTKGWMRKEKFENWAKDDVTHIYIGVNSEGVCE